MKKTSLEDIKRIENIPFDLWIDSPVECKAGRVELKRVECEVMERNDLYVCTSTAIYQINYSRAQGFYYPQKLASWRGLAARGRWYALDGSTIERITNGAISLI